MVRGDDRRTDRQDGRAAASASLLIAFVATGAVAFSVTADASGSEPAALRPPAGTTPATDVASRREPRTRQEPAPHVPIDCGGYDEDRRLVDPDAARTETAPVGSDGLPRIPERCGGYDAEGAFVGDD